MTQPKNRRAYNIKNLLAKKHKDIKLSKKWAEHIGIPESNGVWIIWGESGNGKSSYVMQMVQELCQHGKVIFNDLEEGTRKTAKKNVLRAGLDNDSKVIKNFNILDKEPMDEFLVRLRKHKSPNIIIINSWQYTGWNTRKFFDLVNEFPNKLFIIISHADGDNPEGSVAKKIKYHADIKIQVKGFKAIPTSRYEVNEEYIIWEKGATKAWMDIKAE